MPRRPGGGASPQGSIEAGLRDLVTGEGPDVRRLGRRETPGLDGLMQAAAPPAEWTPETAAAAVIQLAQEALQSIRNPRWRAAGEAAFRIPPEMYAGEDGRSLAQRLVARAARDERAHLIQVKESYRGYWIACAQALAQLLQVTFEALRTDPSGWDRLALTAPSSQPNLVPISFDRTDVLYRFSGRVGVQSTSYRWLTAHDPVDHYNAVGWYYNEPSAPVEIVPLANCELGSAARDLPTGGRTARLEFDRMLNAGEKYFFAYSTVFNSTQPCRPTILYETRGRRMDVLVVRAQFDPTDLPVKCWAFDVELHNEGWQEPGADAPEVIRVGRNGYAEHEFSACRQGRRYGMRWIWAG